MTDGLPYRGVYGAPRPPSLSRLALPPDRMPGWQRSRPLKHWRYVGVYGEDLMLCLGSVHVGPLGQSFWSVWDRREGRLHGATHPRAGAVAVGPGAAHARGRGVTIDLTWAEQPGIEAVAEAGSSYAWTRKQGGVEVTGTVSLDGERRAVAARAIVDDTAAYYPRRTTWRWSAGVGTGREGQDVAWNLVTGVNDSPAGSERSVWVDGVAQEPPSSRFADDLTGVDDLRFTAEAVREKNENYLVVRSSYRQPFGTYVGTVGGVELREGYGVMEEHDARW